MLTFIIVCFVTCFGVVNGFCFSHSLCETGMKCGHIWIFNASLEYVSVIISPSFFSMSALARTTLLNFVFVLHMSKNMSAYYNIRSARNLDIPYIPVNKPVNLYIAYIHIYPNCLTPYIMFR